MSISLQEKTPEAKKAPGEYPVKLNTVNKQNNFSTRKPINPEFLRAPGNEEYFAEFLKVVDSALDLMAQFICEMEEEGVLNV